MQRRIYSGFLSPETHVQKPLVCSGESEECPQKTPERNSTAGPTLFCLEGEGSLVKEEMVLSWKN